MKWSFIRCVIKEGLISPRNRSEIVIVILLSGCECLSNCQEAHEVQSPSACGPAIENTHCTQARVCLRLTWMESATTPRSPAWEIFGAGGRGWEGNWSINNVDRCASLSPHIVTRMVKEESRPKSASGLWWPRILSARWDVGSFVKWSQRWWGDGM